MATHRYELKRPLSPGGPWLAHDRWKDQGVVLKITDDNAFAEHLIREGRLLGTLRHRHLIPVFEVFRSRRQILPEAASGFVTPHFQGLPLTDALRDAPLDDRLTALRQLTEVVAYMHRRKLLHLDLKPDNVLHGEPGVMVIDLGLALPASAPPGLAGGSPGYAAPEVVNGQQASPMADVYSLGIIFIECLAGIRFVEPDQIADLDVPEVLKDMVRSMVARVPLDRPQTVETIAAVLKACGTADVPEGAPPLVGREAETSFLRELLSEPGTRSVQLVGPQGSGRRRLLEEVCVQLPSQVLEWHPGEGQEALKHLSEHREHVVVCLGELHAPETVVPDLAALDGHTFVWTCSRQTADGRALRLGPLPAGAFAELARYFGVTSGRMLRELAQRTGGLPGPLMIAMGATEGSTLSQPLQQALDALSSLPAHIPRAALQAIPKEVRQHIGTLEDQGHIRRALDGTAVVLKAHPDPRDHRSEHEALLSVLEQSDCDPEWLGLFAARLERHETAKQCFERLPQGIKQSSALLELSAHLVGFGHRSAFATWARCALLDGSGDAVVKALSGLADLSSAEARQLARAYRKVGNPKAAESVALRAASKEPQDHGLIEEIGMARIAMLDVEGAAKALQHRAPGPWAPDGTFRLRLMVAAERIKAGRTDPHLDELQHAIRTLESSLPPSTISLAGRLLFDIGKTKEGIQLMVEGAQIAEQTEPGSRAAAGIRSNLGRRYLLLGHADAARRSFEAALLGARQSKSPGLELRVLFSLAKLEIQSGRTPTAERYAMAFLRMAEQHHDPQLRARTAVLEALLANHHGQYAHALACLGRAPPDLSQPKDLRTNWCLVQGEAFVNLSMPHDTLRALDAVPQTDDLLASAEAAALRGRAHLILARDALGDARQCVPEHPDPANRQAAGRMLLAAAGEDLDVATFAARRADLARAADLLGGQEAARAANLRDRLSIGPTASIDAMIALAESIADPSAFTHAVATFVREALGAHRAFVLLRVPGLGDQLSTIEIGTDERPGIALDVMRHIQHPDDVWLSDNAAADPELSRTSKTVRTFGLKSVLAVAIPHQGEAIGALYVDDRFRTHRFKSEDVAALQRLARAIGTMVARMASPTHTNSLKPHEVLGVMLGNIQQESNMQLMMDRVRRTRETNILITGPTGVGKTFLARRIATELLGLDGIIEVHLRNQDLNMVVSQLAGSRRGDFTGANPREGAIQRALRHNHALFVDEIQALSEDAQHILLPLLDLPVRRFGGVMDTAEELQKPLNIILATNAPVTGGRWRDTFRPDLWWRMADITIELPPLSERGPAVIYEYLRGMLPDTILPEQILEPRALRAVTTASWEGNLRQLERFANNIARLYELRSRPLSHEDLHHVGPFEQAHRIAPGSKLVELTQERVFRELENHGWQQSHAAATMGITPSYLSKLIKRWGVSDEIKRRKRAHRRTQRGG